MVLGKFDYAAMDKLITAGKGTASLKTVSGGTLSIMKNGTHNIIIKDKNGSTATISTYDVIQSNGLIHVIDSDVLIRYTYFFIFRNNPPFIFQFY